MKYWLIEARIIPIFACGGLAAPVAKLDIKLHLVAPASRRDKVFQEIQRPLFSLLEKGPLAEFCRVLHLHFVRQPDRVVPAEASGACVRQRVGGIRGSGGIEAADE